MADPDLATPDHNTVADDRFAGVPVEIDIHIGTAKLLISDLLALSEDVVLPLDRSIDDPVELFIGDRLIARGELEETGGEGSGQLGVRVTEVFAPGASQA